MKNKKFTIETNNACAVIKGVKSMEDVRGVFSTLADEFGNKEILYVFTSPDGKAIIVIFK